MSAYREADEAPCQDCEQPTRDACPTCRQPTCAKHFDAQCTRCDEALARYVRTDDSIAGLFALPLLVLGCILLGAFVPPLIPVAVATPFVGLPVMLIVRGLRRRAKFFRWMRERGALPEPKYLELDAADEARLAELDERRKQRK